MPPQQVLTLNVLMTNWWILTCRFRMLPLVLKLLQLGIVVVVCIMILVAWILIAWLDYLGSRCTRWWRILQNLLLQLKLLSKLLEVSSVLRARQSLFVYVHCQIYTLFQCKWFSYLWAVTFHRLLITNVVIALSLAI